MKAIEGGMTALREREDVPAETRPTRADGLRLVAESLLAGGPATGTGADRSQLVVLLEQDALGPDGQLGATLEGGTHVPAETLRRVACDSGLVAAQVDAKGKPLDVGRRTRAIPTPIRRALEIRDRTCRFPGCPLDAWLQGHHIDHWLHGGATSLANLILDLRR